MSRELDVLLEQLKAGARAYSRALDARDLSPHVVKRLMGVLLRRARAWALLDDSARRHSRPADPDLGRDEEEGD